MKQTIYHFKKASFSFLLSMFAILFLSGCSGRTVTETTVLSPGEIIEDKGKLPWVIDIEEATLNNTHYRMAVWTGKYMQMVLMSLKPGEKIDLELHSGHDQFIRIEEGNARILMGKDSDNLTFDETVADDWVVMIPAGYWHQVINTGMSDLKLYTLYAPAEHKAGTVNVTYNDAKEHGHDH